MFESILNLSSLSPELQALVAGVGGDLIATWSDRLLAQLQERQNRLQ